MSKTRNSKSRDEAREAVRQQLVAGGLASAIREGETGEGQWIELLPTTGAEYQWSFWFYANGERHVYATARASSVNAASQSPVIWYHPFEPEDYNNSDAELEKAFLDEVHTLLHHPTRVRITSGRLGSKSVLEVSQYENSWIRQYAVHSFGDAKPWSNTKDNFEFMSPAAVQKS